MDQLLAEVRSASREFWLGGDAALAMSRVSAALRQYDDMQCTEIVLWPMDDDASQIAPEMFVQAHDLMGLAERLEAQ